LKTVWRIPHGEEAGSTQDFFRRLRECERVRKARTQMYVTDEREKRPRKMREKDKWNPYLENSIE
jgi:hypothetical protein